MKGMKKLLSILMVLTLVLSLGAQAFAATVTIEGKPGLPNTHEYTAYQIFTGSQDPTKPDGPLGDVAWGSDIDEEGFLEALESAGAPLEGYTKDMTAQEVAKKLGESSGDAAVAEAFGKLALAHMTGTGTPIKPDATGNASVELVTGYYVIKDTTTGLGDGEVYNDVLVEVVQDTEIKAKNEGPSSDKKVNDVNDSTGETSQWKDSADHDIGDVVEYRLHAHIPATALAAYDKYYLSFEDVISGGLTYNGDAEIYVGEKGAGGVKIETGYTSTGPDGINADTPYGKEYNGGNRLTWTFDDIKTLDAVKNASGDVEFYIYYTATLNTNAEIGDKGNPNKYRIVYNRNPNGEEYGNTEWDINIVFTYNFETNKVDEAGEALQGADFKLLKKLNTAPSTDGKTVVNSIDELKKNPDADYVTIEGVYWAVLDLTVGGTKQDVFTYKGLDDGEYKLVETVTPKGYNSIDPVDFTITAEHDLDSENPQLTQLNNGGKDVPEFTLTKDNATNEGYNVNGKVENKQGPTLPETGGIGTTIFYIAGAVLVAGAVILLVTKKRVSGMEK